MTAPATRTAHRSPVVDHYTVPALVDRIMGGLEQSGKDPSAVTADDLAPVDAFHIRGRAATIELASLVELSAATRVLDVGSGIGGTARYLASTYGCHVTGIDLTASYCDVARELSARVGLAGRTSFHQGSATELPFHDASFDVVWTEHVQMNVADKRRFYAEAARVLRPGGTLVFHDIFAGPRDGLAFPVPWATTADTSFLTAPETVRELLREVGLTERAWLECTGEALAWFEASLARTAASGPPALGLHLVMGETARTKFGHVLAGLRDGQLRVAQASLTK